MSNFLEKLEEFQAHNREKLQEIRDDEAFKVQGEDIFKATSAMLEADVDEEKIKELLIKYWGLKPSDADYFLDKSKER